MENDRVSVSLGQKINMGNYESLDFHYSYSTDVQEGETATDAARRARKEVSSWASKELELHKKKLVEKT